MVECNRSCCMPTRRRCGLVAAALLLALLAAAVSRLPLLPLFCDRRQFQVNTLFPLPRLPPLLAQQQSSAEVVADGLEASGVTAATAAVATSTGEDEEPTTVTAAGGAALAGVDELFLCPDKVQNATIVEQLPQLKIEQVLNSNKPRSPQDITLVTQLSFERCARCGAHLGNCACVCLCLCVGVAGGRS